jgi:hypothetical protein
MNIEKHVCYSLLGILLNILDKTKDGPKARLDMELLGIRSELWEDHTETKTMIKTNLPPACYTLKKAKMHSFHEFLHCVKVSSGFSANIRKLVDMKTHKLICLKSHDCHVMVTWILPITRGGIMELGVYKTIMNL